MRGPANLESDDADDAQARRWLAMLQSGSPDEKARARRGLAEHFETRGLASEAIELLVANAREGYRDADLFQALARMYRQRGDEYLAASAALEATRLSGLQPVNGRPAPSDPESLRDRQPIHPVAGQSRIEASAHPSPWRLPLRIAGWIVVVATVVAAAAVASQHPLSAALYVVSAAALALLLAGAGAARRLVRLPDSPLGDGALLFAWLFLLLAAGAILPRDLTMPRHPARQPGMASPPAVSTPSPSPSSGSGPATPSPSPTP